MLEKYRCIWLLVYESNSYGEKMLSCLISAIKQTLRSCSNYPNILNIHWIQIIKSKWHPSPVLLPGKSQGRKSLVGYSPWGCKESDTTEQLHYYYYLVLMCGYSSHLTMNCLRAGSCIIFSCIPSSWLCFLTSCRHPICPCQMREGGQADSDFMPEKLDGKMA